MLLPSTLIFAFLLGLAVPTHQGFFREPTFYEEFLNFGNNGFRTSRKSHFGGYSSDYSGPTFYTPPPSLTYHHSPPFYHSTPPQLPPHHGPPPSHHHGPPPTFGKPPFHPPHYYPPHHHHHRPPPPPPFPPARPPHTFGSTESFNNNNFEQVQGQEIGGNVFLPTPVNPPNDKVPSCNVITPSVSYELTTKPIYTVPSGTIQTFQPQPGQQATSGGGTSLISGVRPGFVQQGQASVQTITTSAGTTISTGSNTLISGGVAQHIGQQSSLHFTHQNGDKNFNGVQIPSGTNVNNLINGVFPGLGQQTSQQPSISANKDVDKLVSNVFPSLGSQGAQSQQPNPPTSSGTNVNNLISGVFPNVGQQGQQINPPAISSTISSNTNTLISGVFQGLPQQNNNKNNAPTVISSSTTGTQTEINSIPVFQPDYPSPGNQDQRPPVITVTSSTSTTTTTAQKIPVFQPTLGTTSSSTPVTSTSENNAANGNNETNENNNETTNSNDDDAPIFDIDIRFGQIGDEVVTVADANQRNRTKTK